MTCKGQSETVASEAEFVLHLSASWQCKLSQNFFNKPALLSFSYLFVAAKFVDGRVIRGGVAVEPFKLIRAFSARLGVDMSLSLAYTFGSINHPPGVF